MKTLLCIFPVLAIAACTRQPVEATGVYRLNTEEQTLTLDVRTGGDYVLQIDGPSRNTDEIRGRWEKEQGKDIDATFQGIVWHGQQPESAPGRWAVAFESDGGICLDGEGLACFAKD